MYEACSVRWGLEGELESFLRETNAFVFVLMIIKTVQRGAAAVYLCRSRVQTAEYSSVINDTIMSGVHIYGIPNKCGGNEKQRFCFWMPPSLPMFVRCVRYDDECDK